MPRHCRQRTFTTRPQAESRLGSKRKPNLHLITDQRAAQRLHPTTCASLGLTLHVGHRQSVPRLSWRAPTQAGVAVRRVVKALEVAQRNLQGVRTCDDGIFQRGLAVQKQALDDTVLPWAHRQAVASLEAQSAKDVHPQIAAKHLLVVRPNDARYSVPGHRQQHVAQHGQRTFARQQLQAQQTSRAAVNDAQHRKCEATGRDPKRQVQRPRVTHGREYWFAPSHSSPLLCNFFGVLGDEVVRPRVANRHVRAMHGVEGLGNAATSLAKHRVVHHSFAHPVRLSPRANNAQFSLCRLDTLFSSPKVPRWHYHMQMPQRPPAQASQRPQRQEQYEQSHQQIHPLQFGRRLDRMSQRRACR